jgi:hypothetical protein
MVGVVAIAPTASVCLQVSGPSFAERNLSRLASGALLLLLINSLSIRFARVNSRVKESLQLTGSIPCIS